MTKLFELETYALCVLTQTDDGALIADKVGDTDLRVRFERRISHWEVELRIYVARGQSRWVIFMSGAGLTAEHKELWDGLTEQLHRQWTAELDAIRAFALQTLAGEKK